VIFTAYKNITQGANDIRPCVAEGLHEIEVTQRQNIILALHIILIGVEYHSTYGTKNEKTALAVRIFLLVGD